MPLGDIFVHKGKATQFFFSDCLRPLREIVSTVHDITSIATHFIKYFYLTAFFGQWEADNTRRLVIDEDFVSKILALVKSGTIQVRGDSERATAARLERDALVQAYVTSPYFLGDAIVNKIRYRKWSLSFTLAYSAQQLATAYENNIVAHFVSYVKKFVVTSLRRNAMLALGRTRYSALAVDQRRSIDLDAQRAFIDVVERRSGVEARCRRPAFVEWVEEHRSLLMPSIDPRFASLDEHLENDPFAFLPFMVRVNRLLEDLPSIDTTKYARTKLYSPLILRTSYIPSHMCLDTVAMLHLFVDDIGHFKAWYRERFGVDLVMLESKEMLAAAYKRLVGREDVTAEEESLHADRCWEYVGKLPSAALDQQREVRKRGLDGDKKKTKKKTKVDVAAAAKRNPDDYEKKTLRFQRMMVTDGYNLSILLTTAPNLRGKVFGSRKARQFLPSLDPETSCNFDYLLPRGPSSLEGPSLPRQQLRESAYNTVSCDPGKRNILYLTDASGNKVVHTLGKRERQCRHKQTREMTLVKRRKTVFGQVRLRLQDGTELFSPSVEDIETKYLKDSSLKTCFIDRFSASLGTRVVVSHLLKQFYERAFFRTNKYAVYLGTKACNDKLFDQIRNTFGKDDKTIVIFWGNWGQRPNSLRNGPPTPGIGLRRLIHRRLSNDTRNGTTHFGFSVTVCEMKTSSICNACGGDVAHAVSPQGAKLYRVLRCQNNGCSRAWNRDDLGSRNILLQGLHLLQRHSYHPWLTVARA